MNIERVLHEIQYAYCKPKYFKEFILPNIELVKSLNEQQMSEIEANGKSAVKKYMDLLDKQLMGKRKVVSGLKKSEMVMPNDYAMTVARIRGLSNKAEIYFKFPLEGIYDAVIKFPRGAETVVRGMSVNKDTKFLAVKSMQTYAEPVWSIGLSAPDMSHGVSLASIAGTDGVKGSSDMIVTVFDEYVYYIDNWGKYKEWYNNGFE